MNPDPASTLARSLAAALVLGLAGGLAPAANAQTGDVIDGKPVITQLDLEGLEAGKTHMLYFESVEMGSGQHWYIPVVVAKGANPGSRVTLISGVHGDELTPVAVAHEVMGALDPGAMSGSVIAIMEFNRPGIEYVTRTWPMNNLGITTVDPNRVFPGNETGNTVQRQAWLLMEKLIRGNTDIAIDMHTGGNGSDFAHFVFA